MPTCDQTTVLRAICPPLDQTLTGQLLDEFISQERRYILGDWEPAELDGGQFCEAGARILYHQDSATLNRTKDADECLKYIEDPKGTNSHKYPNRKSALHTAKVLRTAYKFRSDRGAVHITPEYTANHLDSRLIIECARWVLCEFLRLFWGKDQSVVARVVREIIQYDVPVIGDFEGRLVVQRTDCCAEEEILILLHRVGEVGLSRSDLGRFVQKDPSRITRGLAKLAGPRCKQIIRLNNGNYRLTALGTRRVLTELAHKLIL